MRVLVAFDKFKGSLSAAAACATAAKALRECHPDWQVDTCPLTDGGDGFTDILVDAAAGRRAAVKAIGPRGGLVDASVGLVDASRLGAPVHRLLKLPEVGTDEHVAVVEMAAASGLERLAPSMRDPWQATSYGTGQLVRAAAEAGATAILLGVGGSATIDLGLGALAALGIEFRGPGGGVIHPPLPARWPDITRLDGEVFSSIPPISIACDVTNPVLGANGAAAVYGPQKGLRACDLRRFESVLERMIVMLSDYCGQPARIAEVPGTGAAGGVPFGLVTAARARLVPGFELVSAWLDLDARITAADLVLTGEGRFDQSSLSGKGPGAVARTAIRSGRPVHVFAGAVDDNLANGEIQLHAITPVGYPLENAMREAATWLTRRVRDVFRSGSPNS